MNMSFNINNWLDHGVVSLERAELLRLPQLAVATLTPFQYVTVCDASPSEFIRAHIGHAGDDVDETKLQQKYSMDNGSWGDMPHAAMYRSARDSFRSSMKTMNDGGIGIVLGLRHHLPGNGIGLGGTVAEDEQLTRSRRRIDGNGVHELQLGFGHVGIARSHDAIDARHTLGANRERGNRASTTQREDTIDVGEGCGGKHDGGGLAIGPRRRADDHFTHTGDARRNGTHE
jgi:hypothetical protein